MCLNSCTHHVQPPMHQITELPFQFPTFDIEPKVWIENHQCSSCSSKSAPQCCKTFLDYNLLHGWIHDTAKQGRGLSIPPSLARFRLLCAVLFCLIGSIPSVPDCSDRSTLSLPIPACAIMFRLFLPIVIVQEVLNKPLDVDSG